MQTPTLIQPIVWFELWDVVVVGVDGPPFPQCGGLQWGRRRRRNPPFHSANCSSMVTPAAQGTHPPTYQGQSLYFAYSQGRMQGAMCGNQIKRRGESEPLARGVREAGVYAGASASQQKRRRCSATGGHLRWCAPLLAGLLPEQLRSVLSLGRPAKLPLSASSPSGPGLVLLGCAALLPLLVSRLLGAKVVRVVLQGSAGRGSCRGSRGRGRLGRSGKASGGVARLRFKQG